MKTWTARSCLLSSSFFHCVPVSPVYPSLPLSFLSLATLVICPFIVLVAYINSTFVPFSSLYSPYHFYNSTDPIGIHLPPSLPPLLTLPKAT
ncbi:hypothetical protein LZ32DRAFT_424413 [Colletotrichum eremochloae]|nr:hypothetical protein LY78DRAFT_661885 [Colletotrichum sublineola]KAK2017942.1 hypothetical protein LZ32DRAFT_424413 [Colletotrichum eremochloae]